MNQTKQPVQLKVLIVGAGIGGLTAAIALRRAGHEVEMFEASPGPSEIGAAINICYNADSVLKHIGVNVAEAGGVRLERLRILKASGELLKDQDLVADSHRWQGDYRLTLRAALHGQLRDVATSLDRPGPPARMSYSSRVVSVDADNASVCLGDGTTRTGDLVLGADGVTSVARVQIDPDIRAKPGRHSAFRFLVSETEALADARTAEWFSTRNTMDMWYSGDSKIVMYRCQNNELLNFICIHPASKSSTMAGDWHRPAAKSVLLDIFRDFEPRVLAMLEKADPNSLRVYPLLDMDTLPTFISTTGRLALLGDAAHPFLPHLAQGGAMAIEDGISLGVMMSQLDSLDEIPARLRLYNRARYDRATLIQEYTRRVGGDSVDQNEHSAEKLSLNDYMQYPYSHDEQHASEAILRQYLWSKHPELYWRQPVAFGPMPGPRQDFSGAPQRDQDRVRCTTATIVFKTSATLLRNFFPSVGYSFKDRDTVQTASIKVQQPSNLAWLGGGGYELVGFYIHNVIYAAPDGSKYAGAYLPLMCESLSDPITTGREELGFPKVYSEIHIHESRSTFKVRLSWRETSWAEFTWPLVDVNGSSIHETAIKVSGPGDLLVHRRMPAVGRQNDRSPDADYTAYYPSQEVEMKVVRERECSAPAEISFTPYDWQKLPTLHHIAERLAELPIMEIVESSIVETEGWTNFEQMTKVDV